MAKPPTPVMGRFLPKVDVPPAGVGCWIWTGAKNKQGYGYTFVSGNKPSLAHRVAYEEFLDKRIPIGMEIDHTCNVRACVNPAHLDVVSHQENKRREVMRRQARKGGA